MAGAACIANQVDGTLCRAPACIFDDWRGGMGCLQHVLHGVSGEIVLYLRMRVIEERTDNDAEALSKFAAAQALGPFPTKDFRA